MDYGSNNLVVPRGSLLFSPFATGTMNGTGFLQLGNCPEFMLSRDVQSLDHRSSQQGYRTRDERVIIGDDLTGSVITDDCKAENMRLWFMSAVTAVSISSASNTSEVLQDVIKGRTYQLGRSTVAPTGLRGLTVDSVVTGATTYTAGTDYELDGPNGLLTILESGTVVADSDLTVTYDVAASTYKQVTASNVEAEGELMFVSNNPFGAQQKLFIPRAKIGPNGDLNMLTDPDSPTWMQIPLMITVLKKGTLPLAYRDGIPVA